MNSGYIGFSRSVRSQRARNEGKMTATDFAKWVKKFSRFSGCIAADVSAVLTPCEWHHTSKRFNRTNYFDPRDLLSAGIRVELAKRISTRKSAQNGSLAERFAAEASGRGLAVVVTCAGSTLIHAVSGDGVVCGQCRTADDKVWGRKAGIHWFDDPVSEGGS